MKFLGWAVAAILGLVLLGSTAGASSPAITTVTETATEISSQYQVIGCPKADPFLVSGGGWVLGGTLGASSPYYPNKYYRWNGTGSAWMVVAGPGWSPGEPVFTYAICTN